MRLRIVALLSETLRQEVLTNMYVPPSHSSPRILPYIWPAQGGGVQIALVQNFALFFAKVREKSVVSTSQCVHGLRISFHKSESEDDDTDDFQRLVSLTLPQTRMVPA